MYICPSLLSFRCSKEKSHVYFNEISKIMFVKIFPQTNENHRVENQIDGKAENKNEILTEFNTMARCLS